MPCPQHFLRLLAQKNADVHCRDPRGLSSTGSLGRLGKVERLAKLERLERMEKMDRIPTSRQHPQHFLHLLAQNDDALHCRDLQGPSSPSILSILSSLSSLSSHKFVVGFRSQVVGLVWFGLVVGFVWLGLFPSFSVLIKNKKLQELIIYLFWSF